jgi:hypothetical protein
MDIYRRSGIFTGILFIAATAAGVAGLSAQPMLGAPDFLAKASAGEPTVLFSALMVFVMGLACGGIAIAMYPVLRRYGEAMALGAVGFRIMEGAFHCAGAVLILLMASLSREFVKAGPAEAARFQALGTLIAEGREWTISVGAILCWCAGASLYYALFFKTKLVPRWLSLWGLIGIALAIGASLLVLFRRATDKVMALWLIVKGFDPKALIKKDA